MSFEASAGLIVPKLPRGGITTFVEVADAAGDRNRFREVARIVKDYPQHCHRVVCAGKAQGEHQVPARFSVPEGGLPVAVSRLRYEGIRVNDGGFISDPDKFLNADALRGLLAK